MNLAALDARVASVKFNTVNKICDAKWLLDVFNLEAMKCPDGSFFSPASDSWNRRRMFFAGHTMFSTCV